MIRVDKLLPKEGKSTSFTAPTDSTDNSNPSLPKTSETLPPSPLANTPVTAKTGASITSNSPAITNIPSKSQDITESHSNAPTNSADAEIFTDEPQESDNLNTSSVSVSPTPDQSATFTEEITSVDSTSDFVNSTGTELPFYDTDDLAAETNDTSTDTPSYYYYDYDDSKSNDTDSSNPFLQHDYDYYYYNPDVERLPEFDYTQVDQEEKREEALAVWKNVDIPPKVNDIDFTPRDLNPYFLVLPPILCLLFLVLVFVPCFFLKLRDDIRVMQGKERKWGSQRRRKHKKLPTQSFQPVDQEWHMAVPGKNVSDNPLNDVQYISQQPGKKGQNGTFAAKDNPAYVEENEVTPSTSSASCSSEPPVDYADQEASCTLGKENEDSMRSEEAEPQQGSERKGSGSDKNFPMGVMATYPKFTGWNKDLYSDEAGLPPPPPPIATDISHDKTSAENQS